jgi:hypothetical protein
MSNIEVRRVAASAAVLAKAAEGPVQGPIKIVQLILAQHFSKKSWRPHFLDAA